MPTAAQKGLKESRRAEGDYPTWTSQNQNGGKKVYHFISLTNYIPWKKTKINAGD